MDLIKYVKRKYWERESYMYELGEPDTVINKIYTDPQQREKAQKEIETKRKFYEQKIKENS